MHRTAVLLARILKSTKSKVAAGQERAESSKLIGPKTKVKTGLPFVLYLALAYGYEIGGELGGGVGVLLGS